MQDLSVADHPVKDISEWVDPDELPRTDVLHYLDYRVNLTREVDSCGRLVRKYGDAFTAKKVLVRRVRLIKTCDQWHYVSSMQSGGHAEFYRCTGVAKYILADWSNGPTNPDLSLACSDHLDQYVGDEDTWMWLEALHLDGTPVSV